jgi:hypothetical protein
MRKYVDEVEAKKKNSSVGDVSQSGAVSKFKSLQQFASKLNVFV